MTEDSLYERALAVALRQFGYQGIQNPQILDHRSARLLARRGWNAETRLTTVEVAAWFTEIAKGLSSEALGSLRNGFAPVAERSLSRVPYFGGARLLRLRLSDTHSAGEGYRVYDFKSVSEGGLVGRVTHDWATYIFIRTPEGWAPFVFALKSISDSATADRRARRKRAKERAAKKAKRKLRRKSAGTPTVAPPFTNKGTPTFMHSDPA